METLLDFRRMEDGAQAYRLERLRVSEVVRDVATRFTEEASRRGYTLETNIPENLPDVMADASALALAIWNLLDNAVKYSPSNKTVTLTVRAEMSGVAIAVSDRGLGIAPDEQQRVFARFARGRSAQVSGAGGTGLGLAIVRHIVDAHRGDRASERTRLRLDVHHPPSGPSRGGRFVTTILIAEDDRILAGTLKDDLELEGA